MLNIYDFILISISDELRSKAQQKANQLGELNNSILHGSGNYTGYLGELAVCQYLHGYESQGRSIYNHDIVLGDKRIEVKSKKRSVKPRLDYEISIARTSIHQNPDIYCFTSMTDRQIWLIGYISREDFFDFARFVPKGYFDKSNNFTCREDMYNLEHKFLFPMKDLN